MRRCAGKSVRALAELTGRELPECLYSDNDGKSVEAVPSRTIMLAGAPMRDHLATLLDDFRRHVAEVAVVRYQGNRRRVTTYGELARLAGRFAALLVQRGIGPGDRVCSGPGTARSGSPRSMAACSAACSAVPWTRRDRRFCRPRGRRRVPNWQWAMQCCWPIARQTHSSSPARLSKNGSRSFLLKKLAQFLGSRPRYTATDSLHLRHYRRPKGIVLTHRQRACQPRPIERATQPYLRYERLFHPLRFLHTLP